MAQYQSITTIWMISMFLFLTPIYIYLVLKWNKLHNHFVIRNRFPNISIAVFTFSILNQLFTILEFVTRIYYFHLISKVVFVITLGLIFHRTHLIYIRWAINAKHLRTMTEFKSSVDPDAIKPTWHTTLITNALFLTIVVIIPALMLFVSSLPNGACGLYTCQMLIGTVLALRIFRSNVSESLDCIKESAISIVWTFIMAVASFTIVQLFPQHLDIYSICGFYASAVIGCCALYFGIRLIHKVEQSKKTPNDLDKAESELTASPISMHPVSSMSNSVALPTDMTTFSQLSLCMGTSSVNSEDARHYDVNMLTRSLVNYLKIQQHYQLFAGYLSECFALENLLFLERGIMLFHMILRYKEADSSFVAKNEKSGDTKPFVNKFYDLSFDYLPQMYEDMERIIEEAVDVNTDTDAMMYKRGIVNVMKLIYDGCCHSRLSETPINTSYAVQRRLQMLMEDNDEQRLLEVFDDYEGLLHVFHDAMVEIWDICECVYDFQFKSYCKNQSNPNGNKNNNIIN